VKIADKRVFLVELPLLLLQAIDLTTMYLILAITARDEFGKGVSHGQVGSG
jgi:hypothetical protein